MNLNLRDKLNDAAYQVEALHDLTMCMLEAYKNETDMAGGVFRCYEKLISELEGTIGQCVDLEKGME